MSNLLKMVAWDPIDGLTASYSIYSIYSDRNEFDIILAEKDNQKRRVHIIFSGGVKAYRMTDDLIGINLLHLEGALNESEKKTITRTYTIFRVTNSEYLGWAAQISNGNSEHLGLIHFAICTADWTLEILNDKEPQVEIVDEQ